MCGVFSSSDVRPSKNPGIRWQPRRTRDGSKNPKARGSSSSIKLIFGRRAALKPYRCPVTMPNHRTQRNSMVCTDRFLAAGPMWSTRAWNTPRTRAYQYGCANSRCLSSLSQSSIWLSPMCLVFALESFDFAFSSPCFRPPHYTYILTWQLVFMAYIMAQFSLLCLGLKLIFPPFFNVFG